MPLTNTDQLHWMEERAKRHLFFFLMTEAVHKYRIRDYHVQQRFANYKDLVKYMDEQWEKFQDQVPGIGIGAAGSIFGTKIDAGFQYDSLTGEETTYSEDNRVIFTPTEDD